MRSSIHVDGEAIGVCGLHHRIGPDGVEIGYWVAQSHCRRGAAVRAHLYELAGERAAAREHYRLAARRTTSRQEQRYLEARAAGCEPSRSPHRS